jgi:hypothetical protein
VTGQRWEAIGLERGRRRPEQSGRLTELTTHGTNGFRRTATLMLARIQIAESAIHDIAGHARRRLRVLFCPWRLRRITGTGGGRIDRQTEGGYQSAMEVATQSVVGGRPLTLEHHQRK